MKSPFANSRFSKPIIDSIGDSLFLSLWKNENVYNIRIFELTRGGINLSLQINNGDVNDKNFIEE